MGKTRNDDHGSRKDGIVDWLNADDEKRDAAGLVVPHLDYESQLIAILQLLGHQRRAEKEIDAEIDKLATLAKRSGNEHTIELWCDRVSQGVYQAAAHSMAAVGMIAPFVESTFYQAFRGIERAVIKADPPLSRHERWRPPAEDQWDCRYVWKNGRRSRNVVGGIAQLADAIGLLPHLPDDTEATLSALFEYRNKTFHFGFEWPIEERRRFDDQLRKCKWPADWFSRSTIDEDPWIFYMSSNFIDHCLATAGEIITGIGHFCDQRLYSLEDGSLAIKLGGDRP